jgi:hypothetical protein
MFKDSLALMLLPDGPYVLARHLKRLANSEVKLFSILDIGGGSGALWREVERLIAPELSLSVVLLDGAFVDSSNDLPNWSRRVGIVPEVLADFIDGEFDFVTAFEVIEHMPKHDGFLLMYEMERIASRGFGLSTPNNFMWQPPSPNNKLNSHVSSWTRGDFKRFGMERIYLHSSSLSKVVLGYVARRFLLDKVLARFDFFEGLSAWRWHSRSRENQPLI